MGNDGVNVIPLFCTTVTHFQIDYQAFQQLAHPDYGLMNLRFRCIVTSYRAAALLIWHMLVLEHARSSAYDSVLPYTAQPSTLL